MGNVCSCCYKSLPTNESEPKPAPDVVLDEGGIAEGEPRPDVVLDEGGIAESEPKPAPDVVLDEGGVAESEPRPDVVLDEGGIAESETRPEPDVILVEGTGVVAEGVVQCCCFINKNPFHRFVTTDTGKEKLNSIQEKIKRFREEIVLKLIIELHKKPSAPMAPADPNQGVHRVGLGERVLKVMEMLKLEEKDKVLAVVLHGMPGVGKSTLAGEVYRRISRHFPGRNRCHVEIGEKPSQDKILLLKKTILAQLTGNKEDHYNNTAREELEKVFKLSTTPLFVYIDNVLDSKDLLELLPQEMKPPTKQPWLW